ncbi:MAG: methyltransferase domain-containing protein [Deltaproteobacteria bacterium]|nr:methyltransferase domain-containing protein [Deltaproteobacteria bacterium]
MSLWGRKKIGEMTPAEIRRLVAEKYATVAQAPQARYKFRVGSEYACDLGYPTTLLSALPPALSEAFTGVSASLATLSEVKPGETVLELGCGGGLDTALLADRVGPEGRVIGVDCAGPMLARAQASLRQLGYSNVSLFQAPAECLPLADNSVDCVVSNGIFNLSAEKDAIFAEIKRVLKPGGRAVNAEIVLRAEPTQAERDSQEDWFT